MKFKKGYPYIGKGSTNAIILFTQPESGIVLESAGLWKKGEYIINDIVEENFQPFGKEYLPNTYGKVESAEHREFIIKLAENSGFNCRDLDECYWFSFDTEDLFFDNEDVASDNDEKLITIPMPPSEKDHWPQVGDEAFYSDSGSIVKVLAIDAGFVWCVTSNDCHLTIKISKLSKPKTEEELLKGEVLDLISGPPDCYEIADILFRKYNITRRG